MTDDELDDARRLKDLFLRVKSEHPELTQESLAHQLGWKTQGAVSHYLDGRTPLNLAALLKFASHFHVPPETISPRLAAKLKVDTDESASGRLANVAGQAQGAMRPILVWESEDDLPPGQYLMVPTLSLELSAGNGKKAVHIDYKQPKAFLADWIREKRLRAKYLVSMKAAGDSMSPWINDGDAVVIDLSDKEIRDGKPYAIRYGDELRIKNIYKRFDGGLILRSLNPSYADEAIQAADLEHVEIIGLIVWRAG